MPTIFFSAMDLPLVITCPYYLHRDECGYCHGSKEYPQALQSDRDAEGPKKCAASVTMGASVEMMSCRQYDELINQGFRRSGTFLYKNDMLRNCCRLYTIRTNMSFLQVSKPQRKTINRFIRAITDGTDKKPAPIFDPTILIEAEQKSTTFYTRFEPSEYSQEKFNLYKKYQVNVHNDKPEEVNRASFERFLCQTPFQDHETEGTPQQWAHLNNWIKNWTRNGFHKIPDAHRRIGPTHECYYLNDKLIAVSILDFLPSGLSSIYFIWDTDYAHLSLGSLSGLREIQMCQELDLGYYYLGYYIEDCNKMNYKGKFGGELLDVVNEVYVPLDKVSKLIKDGRLFVLGDSHTKEEPPIENDGYPSSYLQTFPEVVDVADILYGKQAKTYTDAETAYKTLKQELGLRQTSSKDHRFPLVIPGVTPVLRILEMVEAKALDRGFNLYHMLKGYVEESTIQDMTPKTRQAVIDCIRLFGLNKVVQAIIIMTYS